MGVDQVIAELRIMSGICRTFSVWPGLGMLATEADVLDGLIADRTIIEEAYTGVEAGINFIEMTVAFFKSHNLLNAIKYLTTMTGVKTRTA